MYVYVYSTYAYMSIGSILFYSFISLYIDQHNSMKSTQLLMWKLQTAESSSWFLVVLQFEIRTFCSLMGPKHDTVIKKSPRICLPKAGHDSIGYTSEDVSELCNKCSCLHSLCFHTCNTRELLAFFKKINVKITCKS